MNLRAFVGLVAILTIACAACVQEPGRRFAYHVEGALVRALLGQDQKRLYELRGKQLVITPPRPTNTGA